MGASCGSWVAWLPKCVLCKGTALEDPGGDSCGLSPSPVCPQPLLCAVSFQSCPQSCCSLVLHTGGISLGVGGPAFPHAGQGKSVHLCWLQDPSRWSEGSGLCLWHQGEAQQEGSCREPSREGFWACYCLCCCCRCLFWVSGGQGRGRTLVWALLRARTFTWYLKVSSGTRPE